MTEPVRIHLSELEIRMNSPEGLRRVAEARLAAADAHLGNALRAYLLGKTDGGENYVAVLDRLIAATGKHRYAGYEEDELAKATPLGEMFTSIDAARLMYPDLYGERS